MNTTPDSDDIGQTVPLEGLLVLRALALLRLGLVVLALHVCAMQLLRIGVWTGMMDRVLIGLGVMAGLGLYSDGLDYAWRKLGRRRRPLVALTLLLLAAALVVFAGHALMTGVAFVTLSLLLTAMAHGLLQTAIDPRRTARYRQMQRYLRTLPRSERRLRKDRLERNFQTLLAEGFH